MASMVHAYKAYVNGTQFQFGVEIPHNTNHSLELNKANRDALYIRDEVYLGLKVCS